MRMKLQKPITLSLLMVSLSSFSSSEIKNLPHANPEVNVNNIINVSDGVTVIGDDNINYVPNIGIIEGRDSVLVVDTGLGLENGRKVYSLAKKIAGDRKIFLTSTHFHPEHSFGANSFQKNTTYIINKNQKNELDEKKESYLAMFRSFGEVERNSLEKMKFRSPEIIYERSMVLDLGGKKIIFKEAPAHTQGDQLIYSNDGSVVFTGDLYENGFHPIMPDKDSSGDAWIKLSQQLLNDRKLLVVVPGHGRVGGKEIIKNTDMYLTFTRDGVAEAIKDKLTLEETIKKLTPIISSKYNNWSNNTFISFAVSTFYSEISGNEKVLPNLVEEMKK
ncbi:Metallo-beta-lactamase superfamily [Serratia proteamaculans]|uniref:MBL fold metallo-hydrolase n=1 Tax=Serratia proteamaculans TaxID=28151 RepID=UPI00217A4FB2|nr:MBL fold metallo-hydrolase [Serratia proteamaculans]CAI1116553.1 Metallo-beta-lactamase superfamily [Serratia proteamaculans]